LWKLLEEYLGIALVCKDSATTNAKSIGDRNGTVSNRETAHFSWQDSAKCLETEDVAGNPRDHPEGRVVYTRQIRNIL
jgi:hypothetical protein